MLIVHALPFEATDNKAGSHPFDVQYFDASILISGNCEYLRIDHRDKILRFDVRTGSLRFGPVSLSLELSYDCHIASRLGTIMELAVLDRADAVSKPFHRMANGLLALRAHDARVAGFSLRAIASTLFGKGDWPGDGEHRKSKVRRLVKIGEAMVSEGPRAILAE